LRLWHVAAIAGIAFQATPGACAWLADVEVGAFHDDNLTRAQAPADRRADRALAARASLGQVFVLSGYDAVSASGDVAGEAYARYPGLGFASIGGSVGYRRKLRLGIDAPYVGASARRARPTPTIARTCATERSSCCGSSSAGDSTRAPRLRWD
jgi:hypothetical protein